jgi:hypothetical protein
MTGVPCNSINEVKKPQDKRVYHNNKNCTALDKIPQKERRPGDAKYRLCTHCKNLNAKARKS